MIDYRDLIIRLRSAQRREDALAYGIFGAKRSILYDQAADAIEELLDAVPKWMSVDERLPDIGEIVLVYVDELSLIIRAKIIDSKDYRGERRIDWAHIDRDPFFLSCYTITHWMPLPEPPKEVE